MSFQEKMQSPAPDRTSASVFFSAWRRFWAGIFHAHSSAVRQEHLSLSQDFPKQDCTPELRGLLDMLQSIRKRILANNFLGGWTAWSIWILIGLIVVLAISPKLAFAMILAAFLAAAGAGVILLWTWRTRLSTYQTACRLDSAASLQDRVSTAIYLGDTKNPDTMIERQRGDALARIAKLDPRGLFPLQAPVTARRAAALVLVVAALYAYRLHHKPPLVALLQSTARSPLVQSIISPLVNAMEKDLQRTLALVSSKPDVLSDETRQGDAALSSDDLWQSNNEKGADAKEGQQEALETADGASPQDQMQPPNDQNAPSSQSEQEGMDSPQAKDGKNSSDSGGNNSQKKSSGQGSQNSKESLSQSLMQALKNMMSNSPNQKSNDNGSKQSQPNTQGAPQSGDSHQPGNSESDKKGDSRGSSDAKQKATQSASNGAGSQQGLKDLRKELDAHPVNAVPDRVALEASGFKDQTRMRVDTETGAAQMALRDASPQAQAVINGAEQENIPPRYRLYVQRYFEHADKARP
ncbi:MAG: MSCRAMM family adhesin SdrC [Acidobacteriia bacterium]|nr:MSCRAMM family adhesin SdrC [Terriglobia bacterium]